MIPLPFKSAKVPKEIQDEVNKLHPVNTLFGSRYMALFWSYSSKVTEDTDWDFAFPYEGAEYLEVSKAESLGWVQKPTDKYKDAQHFITWEKVIGGHKVQMCSKINYQKFVRVFQSLGPAFYWRYLHKSSPDVLPKETQTAIFDQLYVTADGY